MEDLWYFKLSSVRPNTVSLKYQRFTCSGYKDVEIRKSDFMTRTPFLCYPITFALNQVYTKY